jgi:glycosyltransferase involved in cell wall biosynthesis
VSAVPATNEVPPASFLPTRAGVLLDGVSVVLPAHNEEPNLIEAIREALAATEPHSLRQEVIVVDDGSVDGTRSLVEAIALFEPRVRLVVHESNLGYGSAVGSGIAAARMEWVLLTDADLQFDLGQLSEFVPHTRGAELVVGYRAKRSDPFMRRVNARGWNALVNLLFRLPVRDVDCAFKLIRRDMLDGGRFVSTGATIDTELLATALRRGGRIVELPVTHRPRAAGEASGADLRVIARAFREIVKVRLSTHEPQRQPELRPLPDRRAA